MFTTNHTKHNVLFTFIIIIIYHLQITIYHLKTHI